MVELETLTRALALDPVPVDESVANAWARLRVSLRDAGVRMPLNGPYLTEGQVLVIRRWIEIGAPNN